MGLPALMARNMPTRACSSGPVPSAAMISASVSFKLFVAPESMKSMTAFQLPPNYELSRDHSTGNYIEFGFLLRVFWNIHENIYMAA